MRVSRTFSQYMAITTLGTLMLFSACKRDNADPAKPNNPGAGDEEVITTVELHVTNPANTADHGVFSWNDADGPGSRAPVIDTIRMMVGITYNVDLIIKDATKTPVKSVSDEIKEEANFHRFHYTYTPALGSASTITTNITDLDTKTPPLPLGLKLTAAVGTGLGKGTFNINLRHFGNNTVKTNSPTDGEADLNVDFPVVVR